MITKNFARQDVACAIVDFDFADLETGVASEAVELPSGAIVTGGYLQVKTAFDSGTSDVMSVGDEDTANLYASAVDLQTVALTALTITGKEYSIISDMLATLTSVGTAATAGEARIVVEYIAVNKSDHTQG